MPAKHRLGYCHILCCAMWNHQARMIGNRQMQATRLQIILMQTFCINQQPAEMPSLHLV